MGCTGYALEKNRVIYFNKGETMSQFQNEIDNCMGLHQVESLLISPIRDSNGTLRAVIQLVNKMNGEKISNKEVEEISALAPSLGEILKTAEEVRINRKIATGVDLQLLVMRD